MTAPATAMNIYELVGTLESGDPASFQPSFDAWRLHEESYGPLNDSDRAAHLNMLSRLALNHCKAAALDFLSSQGPYLTGPEPRHETFAHIAAAGQNIEGLVWLHAHGRSIDTVNQHGVTPLIAACESRWENVAEALLALGADPLGTTSSGPEGRRLDCLCACVVARARVFDEHSMGQLLLRAGADAGYMPEKDRPCALTLSVACADPAVFDMMLAAVMALPIAKRQAPLDQALATACHHCSGEGPNLQSGFPSGRMLGIASTLLKAGGDPLSPQRLGNYWGKQQALGATVGGGPDSLAAFEMIRAAIDPASLPSLLIGAPDDSALMNAAMHWPSASLKAFLSLIPDEMDIEAPHAERSPLMPAIERNRDPESAALLMKRCSLDREDIFWAILSHGKAPLDTLCSLAAERLTRSQVPCPASQTRAAMKRILLATSILDQKQAFEAWIASQELAHSTAPAPSSKRAFRV